MKYISNRFKGYTEADCSCDYCLFYSGKRCQLETCCCEQERTLAQQQSIRQKPQPIDAQPESTNVLAGEPECECDSCNYAGHGFICGNTDGLCMKNGYGRS